MDAQTFEQGYQDLLARAAQEPALRDRLLADPAAVLRQELEGVSGGRMLMDLGRAAKLIEEANRDAHGKDHKKDHHHHH